MALPKKKENSADLYLSIAAGKLVQTVEEGTDWAVKREYKLKDGTEGCKWEIQYVNLEGIIVNAEFKDGDYGKQFILTVMNEADIIKVSMSTDSKYFSSIAKVLPNVDLGELVTINPYDFVTKDGKKLTGVSVKQNDEKVADYYWDGKKNLNGIPTVSSADAKKYDSDDWKIYFTQVKKFLISEIEKMEFSWDSVKEETVEDKPLDIKEAEDVFKDPNEFE